MKVYYNISIAMQGNKEVDFKTLEAASRCLGFLKKDIEDEDTHCVNVMFTSEMKPTDMRSRVRMLLAENLPICYVDVIYRFEFAMVPDRFVIWDDGKCQEYTGYVDFREDV